VKNGWTALAGTPDEVKEKVNQFIAAGIDELTIVPCGQSKPATLQSFARNVIEKL
jgi:alkanesulfonate monooxygenase SsuD/methylene tetrahydromethanopterin reductase-like flavin-dependent oxidoreductase (luciferase family)